LQKIEQLKDVLDIIKFDKNGLVPVIVQDIRTNEILMLAYANRDALELTIKTGFAHFWSRERKKLWKKGEESGNVQEVKEIKYDCDSDAILYRVIPHGPACHTGKMSCFHNVLVNAENYEVHSSSILEELFAIIEERKRKLPEGSYTASLFREGLKKIQRKLGEEALEVILASIDQKDKASIIYESADLIYHLLVLLAYSDISIEKLFEELKRRRK